MRKVIRKADIILFFVLIAVGLAMTWFPVRGQVTGSRVEITVDGKPYGTYLLSKDRTVSVRQSGGRENVVEIRNGQVRMKSATCKNQICVHHDKISRANQAITCLPNRVNVTITGGAEEGGVDVYS